MLEFLGLIAKEEKLHEVTPSNNREEFACFLIDNIEFGHAQTNVPWHISQAAPMRRSKCVGDITLGTGWSSGGYIANTEVTGAITAGS